MQKKLPNEQYVFHTKERTHGISYIKKKMHGAEDPGKGFNLIQHKFRKQQTAQHPLSGSGGISRAAFSTTNPSGASVGGKFTKWSGEIVAHRNISGISTEEIKRARKDTTQLSAQTAYHLKVKTANNASNNIPGANNTNNMRNIADPNAPEYNNFNTSFTGSEIDMMQNPDDYDKDPNDYHMPHMVQTSHLELSGAHSAYKMGLSSAKTQQNRFTVDPHNDEEVFF